MREVAAMSDRYCPACGEPQRPDAKHHHLWSGVTHRHLPAAGSGFKRQRVERRRARRR
jgi:hypothetical protein